MDIRVFRSPVGQENRYQKVNEFKEEPRKKKEDEKQQKKKKNEKIEGIFSSLAENLGQEEDNNF